MAKEEKIKNLNSNIESKYSEKKLVTGNGSINSRVLLIGEAPGKNEVEQGKPFVGAAGKYLSEFLEILKLSREEIYITNVVKYRPTKKSKKTGGDINRTPTKKEINDFKKYLFQEISIVDPSIIVTLGNIPLKTVLENEEAKIGNYHGREIKKKILDKNYTIYPLYHPAAVIYNRSLKKDYVDDLEGLKDL